MELLRGTRPPRRGTMTKFPFGSRPPPRSRLPPSRSGLPPSRSRPPPPPPSGPTDIQIMKRSIDMSFGIIVALLNIAEIFIITRAKKKKIHEMLILSLSVTDLLFGLSNTIVSIMYLTRNGNEEEALEITHTTYFYFVLNSILHLSVIALDRLYAVTKPFHHRVFVTKKKIRIVIAVLWVVSTLIAGSLLLADELTETFQEEQTEIVWENVTTNANVTTIAPLLAATTTILTPRSRPTGTRLKPSRIPKLRKNRIHTYEKTMQLTLSIFIIVADAILFLNYLLVVYNLRKSKPVKVKEGKDIEDRVSIICLFIAASFVVFTLPYACARFSIGHIPLWANLILVANSGMNSIIYFYRGKCDQWQKKWLEQSKAITSTTSTTPLSTPNLKVRHLVHEDKVSIGTRSSANSLNNEASV